MASQQNRWIAASLMHRCGKNPDARKIAAALASIWTDIAAALESIIGRQGVAALYDRSVSLTAKKHLWIASARAGVKTAIELSTLETAITQQTTPDATAGSAELLQQFYDVLVSLIGSALSDQLLKPIRESPPGPPTREA